jgi:hypothetical protein
MTGQRLAKWLKAGYPHLKECGGLPPWLLPEHSFDKIVDGLDDSAILDMALPLELAPETVRQQGWIPDPEGATAGTWREACLRWPVLTAVQPVANACLEASDRISRQFGKERTDINPLAVCRDMLVLSLVPFVPQGRPLFEELAAVLDADCASPAGLITKYADAVVSGDKETVRRVDGCIERHPNWPEWFTVFAKHAAGVSASYRLIAVTPPLSTELAGVLAEIIKEASHGNS